MSNHKAEMNKLSEQQKHFIALILRSPDRGDGWRTVSTVLEDLARTTLPEELREIKLEAGEMHIRLSAEGNTVARWLL